MSCSCLQQNWLEEFIKVYRSEFSLWKIKSKAYHDRRKRAAAYKILIDKLEEIEPNANLKMVKKRINNIRCSFTREYRKVQESSNSGSSDVYEPKLWYYNLLTFLKDQEEPQQRSRSNLGQSDEDAEDSMELVKEDTTIPEPEIEYTLESENETTPKQNYETPLISDLDSSKPLTGSFAATSSFAKKRRAFTNEVLQSVNNHFKHPAQRDDRFDIFGKIVAVKLRDLDKTQRILAEKMINEVLFEAEMGTLTTSHTIMHPTSPQILINPIQDQFCLLSSSSTSSLSSTPSSSPLSQ